MEALTLNSGFVVAEDQAKYDTLIQKVSPHALLETDLVKLIQDLNTLPRAWEMKASSIAFLQIHNGFRNLIITLF